MKVEDLLKKIDEAISNNQPELREHLGASQIGDACRRKLWYQFRWARIRKFPARMLRIFQRGKREEILFRDYLRRAGFEVITQNRKTIEDIGFLDYGGHFAGTVDAVAKINGEWVVCEFKTHNEKSFRRFDKYKITELGDLKHFIQVQIYMHYLKVEKALYLSVNKNTDELYAELVNYDPEHAQYYIDRAKRIIQSQEPLERINDNPSWYLCRLCEFNSICHGKENFAANCRTCSHGAPEIGDKDKVWICMMHQKELTFSEQKDGCDKYEPIQVSD